MILPASISAVIPAHNAEDFIQDAIESVHAQTLPVTEIIVVADDCSDETQKIAERAGAKVLRANGRNVAAARNLGIRAATQEWIASLDADDLWEANKIESQLKASQSFPDAAIISCDLSTLYDGKITKRSNRELRERLENVSHLAITRDETTYFPKVSGAVLRWFTISPPTALIRREVFDTAGFFDETFLYVTELEFFARALKHHSLVFIGQPLVCQRFRKDSHSSNLEGKWASYVSIVDRMLRYPDRYPPLAGQEHREFLKQMFLSYERELARRGKRSGAPKNSRQTPRARSAGKNE
ncbi:MAG: glycosyltransferase family 2 protein [Pyrinomonadaceae bacterium]